MTRIAIHPGEMLREEFLVPLRLSAREPGRTLGVPNDRISELVAGRRSMTAETALRLERYFGMEARFWLNLQTAYELSKAQNDGTQKRFSRGRRHERKGSSGLGLNGSGGGVGLKFP